MDAALGWCNDRILALRDSMTPGQRQTAALAVVLAEAVLLFGAPKRVVEVSAQAAEAGQQASSAAGVGRRSPATSAPSSAGTAGATAPAPPGVPLELASGPELPGVPALGLPAAAASPRLAVLVSADPSYPSSAPGRDDATMARAFLARSGLTATVVADDPGNAGMCRQLSGQADVVVAGAGGVRPALRDCLVGAGRVVVAFDPLGDLGPAPSAPGQVVSTRRGLVDSVTDLGAWGVRSGALAGRVGVVSEVSADRDVDAAAARLAAQGVDVVERAYVHDDPQTASQDVSQGVLAFQSAGVGTVLFAAPVSVQRQWVAQTGVVAPGTRYVVSDAFDGIVDESYPVTFDGALAHTSLRVPWFQRDHGTTAAQSRCDQVWETNAVPPAYISAAETVDAYAWCQGFDLLAAGVRDGAPAGSMGPTLRAERISSPLTSDLGPLGGGGYGPTADAVVVWRSSCSCWSEREPFAPR